MKADNLARMRAHGLPVPEFAVFRRNDAIRLDFSGAERFAVRSTFDAEDSAAHSFAGQFDTLLNVARADVPQAVERVRESYEKGAAQYARAHGMTLSDSADAPVIVQAMVPSEVSGVLFTSNPTGLLNELVIVAGEGLGSAVVEDRADVTTYYYHKDDELYYFERSKDSPLLEETVIERLVSLGLETERLFGAPTDVEYAVSGGEVYLLQARPITTLLENAPIVLDNSNIVESYPDLTLPLTQSFVKEIYYLIFKALLEETTHRSPILKDLDSEVRNMVDMCNGRVYYRISSWYGVLRLLPFSERFIRMWQQMLGVQNKTVSATERRIPARVKLTMTWALLRCLLQTPRRMDELDVFYADFEKCTLSRISELLSQPGPAQIPALLAVYRDMEREVLPRWHVTLINDMYCFMFTYLAGARNKAALADIRNLESMKPVKAIKALAELCRETGFESERYQTAKADFIREYGDRCLGELKLETHTYRTHPALVDEFVRGRLQKPPKPKKTETAAPTKDRFLVRHAKLGIYNRERSRMNRTRLFGMARTIFRTVGEELKREGYLDDAEDVFYLTIPELESGSFARCRSLVGERKAEYAMFAALPPYSRLIFDGEIRNKRVQNAKFDLLHKADVLTGISSSIGTVTGEAVVITEPNLSIDTHDKILVTRSTDPGWVFLIENAKGIIAEKGSLLSHTAIITRELHKPSMVNVRDATKRIRTGDIVELDAASGVIRILQEA